MIVRVNRLRGDTMGQSAHTPGGRDTRNIAARDQAVRAATPIMRLLKRLRPLRALAAAGSNLIIAPDLPTRHDADHGRQSHDWHRRRVDHAGGLGSSVRPSLA